MYYLGIDIGSTTMKVAVADESGGILHTDYRRHNTDIAATAAAMLSELEEKTGDAEVCVAMTGSVGMGYAESFGKDFVQEVICASEVIREKYPEVKTLIDIGGEDSKMIFFEEGRVPDIRMNGNCAGGTGAFIDQTASLIGAVPADMDGLAKKASGVHPIASRCGVFAKTDIQNLLSRNVSREDIAASVLDSVSRQVVASLARGTDIRPKIFLCGGPFAFIPELRKYMMHTLGLPEEECIVPENAQFIPATGAALCAMRQAAGRPEAGRTRLSALRQAFETCRPDAAGVSGRLEPLFADRGEYDAWMASGTVYRTPHAALDSSKPGNYWLGVDSGSTTTKIVLLDADGAIVHADYRKNSGDSFGTFIGSIRSFMSAIPHPENIRIVSSCVTGYGENMLKGTTGIEHGIVETMAHFTAARKVSPDVTFVMDIGGQDMKAIFCETGTIRRMELNEACSSGCGSFLENFADSLGYGIGEFAEMACFARRPCDLGSRCTVFMNSRVKQAMREGALPEDIAAGFSYSVVKNCLFKVLKLNNTDELGKSIVVQGGTFRNHSIVRALEKSLGCRVSFSDIPELMGAYGCALYAMRKSPEVSDKSLILTDFIRESEYESDTVVCPGCNNRCKVLEMTFRSGKKYYSGNNCERIFSNTVDKAARKGVNMFAEKYRMLFDRSFSGVRTDNDDVSGALTGNAGIARQGNMNSPERPLRIGIPRGLGIYEDYPFWHTLLTSCGMEPVLSSPSSNSLYDKGIRFTMSDNICFPAKLMHGHIMDLVGRKVDRILYPYVVYERKDDPQARNSYNCPVVSGYSDVLKSSMGAAIGHGIPFDAPVLSFADSQLMYASCIEYLESLGVDRQTAKTAVDRADRVQREFNRTLARRAESVLAKAVEENRMVILLACRPYHIDPLIEHRISEAIADMGIDVITENAASLSGGEVFGNINAVSQWAWPNRIFKAAWFVGRHPYDRLHFVELTSFGCGPDAFILDEVASILRRHGKNLTALKIDDVNNIGSLKLRIRSLVESAMLKQAADGPACGLASGNADSRTAPAGKGAARIHTKPFGVEDRHRTIVVPYFAEGYSEFIAPALELMGYKAIVLPPGTQSDVETGLKFANNDICYPATIVVGSIINFLRSGKLPHEEAAVIMYQTGGQCRATNYFALIQNAMVAEGFADVPVISVSKSSALLDNQPGFRIDWKKYAKIVVHIVLFADCLSKLYHSAVIREKVPGEAGRLRERYTAMAGELIRANDSKGLKKLAGQAAREFAGAVRLDVDAPKIGVVGEIYVKYNGFSNRNVVRWLNAHGVEVVVPCILNFFLTAFANRHVNKEKHIRQQQTPLWVTDFFYRWIMHYAVDFDRACSAYPYYHGFSDIFRDAEKASRIVNLAGDFGEGWFLPAEISNLAEDGIRNVISLQPFGCIANHIVSKGIEKRIKQLYPQMNLLFLDFDSNTSEANVHNRLHFMVENARQG